jgi:antirestriction protein
MTKQTIIERTVKVINQLPEDKAEEISDFADFLIKRYEEQGLIKDIQNIISESNSFDFLNNEEDLYSESDLKEKFND